MNNELKAAIFTKEDFTDKSIVDFLGKSHTVSIAEYSGFLSSIKVYNKLSENVIRFISSYDDGILRPDKCNAYEPINKNFSKDELFEPISWLSQPGGAFYFKKTKGLKLEGAIENLRFAPIWIEGKLMKPSVPEPVYLGEIRVFWEGEIVRKKGIDYWLAFIKGLCNAAKTNTAILQLQSENNNVLIKEDEIFVTDAVKRHFFR